MAKYEQYGHHAAMGKPQKKSERKWLYLDEVGQARLARLAAAFPQLTETMILGTLATAALKVCEETEFKILPGKFSIIDQPVPKEDADNNRLNDRTKPKPRYPKGSE
jgi:hypothetical protein